MNANREGLTVSLCILFALWAQACRSHGVGNRQGDGAVESDSSLLRDGAAGPDSSVVADADGCQGLTQPHRDCVFGSPITTCVAGPEGWVWQSTCPGPPQDAAPQGDATKLTDCEPLAKQLLIEMSPRTGSCTAVVRFDYANLKMIGHAFVCGNYAIANEASARQSANAVTFPYAAAKRGAGTLLSGPAPVNQWVFYTSPTDFGGVVSVSAHTGLPAFAGSIVWSGTGTILLPSNWITTDIGTGCNVAGPTEAKTIDLTQEVASAEATSRMKEAARIVLTSALPTAFLHWGGTFGTTVLLYPRSVGGFDPSTAEVVVLLDGGWLE